jgi:hypothetical protein
MTHPKAKSGRDPSINGFCLRKGISRQTYNNYDRAGKAPRTIQVVPGGRRIITPAEEAIWDAKYMSPTSDPMTAE